MLVGRIAKGITIFNSQDVNVPDKTLAHPGGTK